ncbi:Gti1/Pac2 family-domain-containing protein [Mycena capillaripes]|nr:Gti1/Pac2 family-domain-containing protein [Mycena capillaripes]
MPHAEFTSFVTHTALHIRNTADAHRVFEAVRLNILPLLKRRLVPHERAQLRSGNIFVWEESDYEDGLVRWTEGRRWSQSKMRGDCLFYEEKIETTEAEKQAKATRRAMRASDASDPIPMPPKRKDRPNKVDGLIKQTYSVAVQMPGASRAKKWHIVAYYSTSEASLLPVVEDYAYLRNIRIPNGVYVSNTRPCGGTLDYFPSPVEIPGSGSSCSSTQRSVSPVSRDNELDSCLKFRSSREHDSSIILPPISPAASPTILPPLASLGYLSPRLPSLQKYASTSSKARLGYYSSTCSDDRRTLDRFRVVI